jgi:2-deoxy-D-gluconate 3-dehydrogenase
MMFDLTGRTALVTGCRRGIGLAITDALAAAGADIIGVSAHLETSDEVPRAAVEGHGRSFAAFSCDFAHRSAVYSFLATLESLGRPIDVLVNNAGIIERAPAIDHPDEHWDRVLEIDLTAPFILARGLGRAMVARGHGKIVFVASILSFQGGINVPGYAAAKSGVAGLTRALANEWAPHGVNVNAIAPGYIATDNTEALRADPVRYQAILDRIPAGRWGSAEDIKGAAVFLASAASDYVHGTVLTVDGGWTGR